MRCEDVALRLTSMMEGDLDAGEEAAALEHLATCSSCEKVLTETRDVVQLSRDHGRPHLSDSDKERMLDSITRAIGSQSDF